MCRTLFYIPNEIGGVPVFGVGWLLLAWLIVGAIILVSVARKEGLGRECIGYLPLLILVAAAIVWVLPAVADPVNGLAIRGFGSMMLVAVASSTGLFIWRTSRAGYSSDLMLSMVFWMFLAGILGARLFYIIEYWPDYHKSTLTETLGAMANFTVGGLVVYGSLAGGLLAMLVFLRRYRLPVLKVLDLLAPCLVLGLAIGRIGCLMNGCCYGGPCEHAWALEFPIESAVYESQIERGQFYGMTRGPSSADAPPTVLGVQPGGPADRAGLKPGDRIVAIDEFEIKTPRDFSQRLFGTYMNEKPLDLKTEDGRRIHIAAVPVAPRSLPVSPTQPLGTLNGLVLLFFLLAIEPFCRREGLLFALLLTLYPVTRFLLEIIRADESSVFGTGLSISQNVSLLLLAGIVVLWFYVLRRPQPGPRNI